MTTTGTLTLADFLLARIAEDEQWAREASRRDQHYAEGGSRWQWVRSGDDRVATLDPAASEFVNNADGDWDGLSLRSEQTFPTMSVGPLPQFALSHVDEVSTTVAGHIARWDPARVLAECEAKRRIVAEHEPSDFEGAFCRVCSPLGERFAPFPCDTLRLLALPYSDHPDYRDEWRV